MQQAVFLDLETIDTGDMDLSALKQLRYHWNWHHTTPPDLVLERIENVQVIISNKVPLTGDTLNQTHNLKLICIAATGTNNVDLEVARELEIPVCNVTGYATPSVVQHTFSLILALTTRLSEYRAAIGQGRWQEAPHFCLLDYPITELSGKTLGIVGFGELGRGVAKLAEALGMRVMIAQRPGGPEVAGRYPLTEMLPEVDVLSLHCPLTPETKDLIDAAALQSMKPSALLINTARGGIVDEQALCDALEEGEIAGAGVDVLTREPPRDDNPLLKLDLTNLIVTPHIAWASRESRQRLINEVAANITAFQRGEARNRV